MKKIFVLIAVAFISLFASAQGIIIYKNDRTVVDFPSSEINFIQVYKSDKANPINMYESIQGLWNWSAYSIDGDNETYETGLMEIFGLGSGNLGYGSTLYLLNFLDLSISVEAVMKIDVDKSLPYIEIPLGQELGVFNFGPQLGMCMVKLGYIDDDSFGSYPDISVHAYSNEDMTEFTFDKTLAGFVFSEDGTAFLGYVWFIFDDIKLTRPQNSSTPQSSISYPTKSLKKIY